MLCVVLGGDVLGVKDSFCWLCLVDVGFMKFFEVCWLWCEFKVGGLLWLCLCWCVVDMLVLLLSWMCVWWFDLVVDLFVFVVFGMFLLVDFVV